MPSTDFSWLIKGQLWRQGVYFALHFIKPVLFGGSCHVFTGVIANDLPFGQSRHCSSNGVWPFCPQKGVGKHLHFLSWSYLPLHFPWADGWSDNLVIKCLNFCQVIRKPQSEVTGSTFAHALSGGGKRKIIREAAAQSNSGPQLDNLKKIDARLCPNHRNEPSLNASVEKFSDRIKVQVHGNAGALNGLMGRIFPAI